MKNLQFFCFLNAHCLVKTAGIGGHSVVYWHGLDYLGCSDRLFHHLQMRIHSPTLHGFWKIVEMGCIKCL